MLVGSDRGLIIFPVWVFQQHTDTFANDTGERLYPTKDIYSGGSCSNTDSLPATLLRILLKVKQYNFIKQRTKYDQPEPKNNPKVFMVVTNVCELLIYACESKEYCGELLKLSTEHNT